MLDIEGYNHKVASMIKKLAKAESAAVEHLQLNED